MEAGKCEASSFADIEMKLFIKRQKTNESVNPLVPGMQNVKIRQFIIGCLLRVSIVQMLVCLDAHYIVSVRDQLVNYAPIGGFYFGANWRILFRGTNGSRSGGSAYRKPEFQWPLPRLSQAGQVPRRQRTFPGQQQESVLTRERSKQELVLPREKRLLFILGTTINAWL